MTIPLQLELVPSRAYGRLAPRCTPRRLPGPDLFPHQVESAPAPLPSPAGQTDLVEWLDANPAAP